MEFQAMLVYPNDLSQASTSYEEYVTRSLRRNLSDTLDNIIFDANRVNCVVISPIKFYTENDGLGTKRRISANVEFSKEILVQLFGGYTYYRTEIDHPSTLKFWDRVKFIFTGEYPR